MATNYNPKVVTNGLVLYLDAANIKSYPGSGTVWSDLSGNGNTGTLTNGPTFSSNNSGTIIFDGTDDTVNCSNNAILNVGNNITVISWFYVNSITPYQVIVSKVLNDFSAGWEFANSNGGQLRLTFRPSATQINLYSTVNLSLGAWHMGGMTFNGTTATLYTNGLPSGQTNSGGPVTLNSIESLRVGSRVQGNFFNGNISQVLMYNRALTDTEVLQNFNATRGRFGI